MVWPWSRGPLFTLVTFLSLLLSGAAVNPTEPQLTEEQIKHFLLTARIIHSQTAKKGITDTARLTLTDGTITHDASFQSVDERKAIQQMKSGRMEINFVDSYKYNIAAYILAGMLGLNDLVPVYVERTWSGKRGSLSWWLPVKLDDEQRLAQKIEPPDRSAWNQQMYRIRVFNQLIYDTDVNLGNILISEDWHIWRVDFSRAFRLHKTLQDPNELQRCERRLLEKLKTLDGGQLATATKGYLTKVEVEALMARRDKILQHFQRLIAGKGEADVLY